VSASAQFGGNAAGEQIRALLDRTLALLEATRQEKPEEADQPAASAADARHLVLARIFDLTSFETEVLLLCLAAELHSEAAELCAAAHNDAGLRFPTFQLALRGLADAHWSATLPQNALRRWNLIEVGAGDNFLTARLSLTEPVLHFLMGTPAVDERLLPLLDAVAPPEVLPSCYRAQCEKLIALLAESREQAVVVHLSGSATRGKHAGAGEAAAAAQLADSFAGAALLCGDGVPALWRSRVERVVLDRPDPASQQALWSFALGDAAARCNGHVERVSTQFCFDYQEILRTGDAVRRWVETAAASDSGAGEQLLASCRAGARGALDVLAQPMAPRAGWRDLVLPESGLESLRAVAAQVRQQGKVLERWGFAAQTSRGLGISALFHGPSGTGKTLAAEVLAHDLGLDLWRIDLSQMVSKYIGETEKNLRAIHGRERTRTCCPYR
jgi:hypothetical protein